jgi:alanine racemase
MDLITLDVTDAPHAKPGDMVDLIGPHHDLDVQASQSGTIGYEILTRIGRRYARRYIESGA